MHQMDGAFRARSIVVSMQHAAFFVRHHFAPIPITANTVIATA